MVTPSFSHSLYQEGLVFDLFKALGWRGFAVPNVSNEILNIL